MNNSKDQLEECKSYYSNGKLEYHYYCNKNGLREGVYKSYYHYSGKLGYHCYYKNGIIEGECKSYHSNGKLGYHCYYKNHLREGEHILYE